MYLIGSNSFCNKFHFQVQSKNHRSTKRTQQKRGNAPNLYFNVRPGWRNVNRIFHSCFESRARVSRAGVRRLSHDGTLIKKKKTRKYVAAETNLIFLPVAAHGVIERVCLVAVRHIVPGDDASLPECRVWVR